MDKAINIYIDLDDVLAEFSKEYNAINRFRSERGFFFNLKPHLKNVEAVKSLIEAGCNVYIISASPNQRCDADKIAWVHAYLPEIGDDRIIITRIGECKADHMLTEDGILLDDYGKNCREWFEKGHVAYKITPEYNIAFWAKLILRRIEKWVM